MEDREFYEGFREKVNEALNKWDSPSVAIGVIKDGETVFCEGFGMRDTDNALPSDKDTLYQIGSCSKSFTAALAAIMVDRGLLDWDTPVKKYIPELRFYDDFTTDHVTMRDLLCHRTGLPRHEYSWYCTEFSREDIMRNLAYLEPNKPFRSTFQYNNQCFILAGLVIERLTGKTWEENVQELIFDPLGMDRSSMYIEDIENDPDHAVPYERESWKDPLKGMKKIPFYKMPPENKALGIGATVGPAGSINSTASDMLKWVGLHLNNGKIGDKVIVSEDGMNELHKPQMLMSAPLDMPMDETYFWCYGMGWMVEMFRGHKILHHGGNINGFSGFMAFVPDLGLGISAYTNMDGSFLHYAMAREIIDHYMGIYDGNWSERYYDFVRKNSEGIGDVIHSFAGDRVEGTSPAHELTEYTGVYTRAGYTPVTVTLENGTLHAEFIGYKVPLEHYHYETFLMDGIMGELPPGLPAHFHTAETGGAVDGFAAPFAPGCELIRFRKEKTE